MTHHDRTNIKCPKCGEPRSEGGKVCWVCLSPYEAQVIQSHGRSHNHQPPSPWTSILRALLVGVAGGVAAFCALAFMAIAFIASLLSAFFEICTGLRP